MSTLTMTIKSIKPPSADKKRGILIGSDDQIIGVFAEKISLFQTGHTYEIDYSETSSSGNTYRNVKGAKEIDGPKPEAGAAKPAPASNGYNSYRETCAKDAERMFVCANLVALIRAGEVKCDKRQLWDATQMLRGLWQHTFGEAGTFLTSEAGKPSTSAQAAR
jgi:hypothetical protein